MTWSELEADVEAMADEILALENPRAALQAEMDRRGFIKNSAAHVMFESQLAAAELSLHYERMRGSMAIQNAYYGGELANDPRSANNCINPYYNAGKP